MSPVHDPSAAGAHRPPCGSEVPSVDGRPTVEGMDITVVDDPRPRSRTGDVARRPASPTYPVAPAAVPAGVPA